mgnify:FL=1
MKTQVHFRGIHPVDDAETRRYAEELTEKLDRIVEFYREDQKRLRLVVEGHRQGYRAGGSLTVPNKALYADAEGDSLTEAMEKLFNRLRKELLRHRAIVRKEYIKKRKYAWQEELRQAQEQLFEEAKKSKEGFGDRFLPLLRNLYRTARRRIILHQLAGELDPGELRPDSVINELVWWQYSQFQQDAPNPDNNIAIGLQQFMRDWIEDHLVKREKETVEISEDGPDLEDPRFSVLEDELEIFYEPPEKLRWYDILEDKGNGRNSEGEEASDAPTVQQTQLIYRALSKLDREEREAFVLAAVEGWSVPEIATITHRTESEVQDSITVTVSGPF